MSLDGLRRQQYERAARAAIARQAAEAWQRVHTGVGEYLRQLPPILRAVEEQCHVWGLRIEVRPQQYPGHRDGGRLGATSEVRVSGADWGPLIFAPVISWELGALEFERGADSLLASYYLYMNLNPAAIELPS